MEIIMKLWKWIVEHVFPGTYDEYLESKKIHQAEIKKYRKNLQFMIGFPLYAVPLFILFAEPGWHGKIIALCVAIGEMLMRDTISEHYCALINRERKHLTTRSS
jgi:hypothetical protein